MTKKQSNNPFKLIGSYVGGLIGFALLVWMFWQVQTPRVPIMDLIKELLTLSNDSFGGYGLILSVIVFVVGFFIGYGIHLTIRKVKK